MPKIVVYHSGFGCDTGCCGHLIEVDDVELQGSFDFLHPYGENHLEFAKEFIREHMGAEHVADLDWDNSLILED